jgi:hypothetical protein
MNAPATFACATAINVDVIGVDAHKVLAPGCGEIAAVFRRSFYVRMAEGMACGGAAEIGRGPLNFLFTSGPNDWRSLLAPGQPVRVEHDVLRLADLPPVDLGHAQIWVPAAFPEWSPVTLAAGLAALEDLLGSFSPPPEGLGCFALRDAEPRGLVARALAAPVERYLHWLAAGCPAHAVPEIEALIGAGPGLTPSGDDFLAGSFLGLYAIGRGDLAQKIWARVAPGLMHRTHAISAAHLSCAAAGRLAEAQHALLDSLLSGWRQGLRIGIKAISEESHTSSWDGLAGMASVLRAVSGYQIQPVPMEIVAIRARD